MTSEDAARAQDRYYSLSEVKMHAFPMDLTVSYERLMHTTILRCPLSCLLGAIGSEVQPPPTRNVVPPTVSSFSFLGRF